MQVETEVVEGVVAVGAKFVESVVVIVKFVFVVVVA